MKTVYNFKSKGTLPDGNKVVVEGTVTAEPDSTTFPPQAAYEHARNLMEKQFPGIKFDGDKEVHGMPVKSFPTLWINRKETERLKRKFAGTEKVPGA